MSNELSTNFAGTDLAEAMGFSSTETGMSGPSIPRLSQQQSPIMVEEVDADGETVEKVVVPLGAFKLKDSNGTEVYSRTATIRLFAQRQQWTQWDSEAGTMNKTVMASALKGDLKDTRGTFNLGRPSKYIKDWNSVDEDTKALMRSIKNTKVLFGKVMLGKAVDAQGNEVKGYDVETDFVMDIKNNDSKKSLEAAMKSISSKKLLPIEHTIKVTSKKESMPTGNQYATIVASLGNKFDMKEGDQETLSSFVDYVDYANDYVLSEWKKLNKPDVAIDSKILDAIVQVEDIPF
tara:strand:- start:2532 stop:3404 length:873 start_codon:yes stop_codon:yes gene_type:complete